MKSDPSLDGGYVEVHQREVEMLVKSESLALDDRVMARVFKNVQGYKVELTSEMNVSFFYLALLNKKDLGQLAGQTKEEAQWLRDIFSGEHKYQLFLKSPNDAVLTISDQQKYKHYELSQLNFHTATSQQLKKSITFRYQRMQLRQKMLDSYWQNISNIIRIKSPSILLQLQHKNKKTIFK